jgi:hypothetical protein
VQSSPQAAPSARTSSSRGTGEPDVSVAFIKVRDVGGAIADVLTDRPYALGGDQLLVPLGEGLAHVVVTV